ncbi:hypothetical protein AB9P05_13490 [Roseivirga sp. BDSF3-8]|uniref:hypothetical protein n=1 Tax=Roseivirga sp. BDSF3-8 TaxID=3241598 RepID=UPI00353245A8
MKYLSAIVLFILITQTCLGQKLQFGMGVPLSEREYYPAVAQIDSVVIYRRDYYGKGEFTPFVRFTMPLYKNISLSGGLTYCSTSAGITAYKQLGPNSRTAATGTLAGLRSFECPVLVHYAPFGESDFSISVFAGIIPVFATVTFDARYQALENPMNRPQEVADVLNKAGTLPKRFYTDYQYGANVSYKRFGLDVFIQQNLTSNINNNLKIWDQEALFTRKTESLRLLLSYTIPLGN